MTEEIGPCPSCGRPCVTTQRGGGWTVDCTFDLFDWNLEGQPDTMGDGFPPCRLKFDLQMDMYPSEAEAIVAWNAWLKQVLTKSALDMLDDCYDRSMRTHLYIEHLQHDNKRLMRALAEQIRHCDGCGGIGFDYQRDQKIACPDCSDAHALLTELEGKP